MSKKQIIIILCCILAVFLITFTIIVIKHKKENTKDTTEEVEHHYAVNPTEEVTTETNDNNETTNQSIVVNNVSYNNLEALTPAQLADKSNFTLLVGNYVSKYSTDKNMDHVDVSNISNDEQVYATVYYDDETSDELVIVYDKFNTHSFMHCVSLEEWQSIQNGDNAG